MLALADALLAVSLLAGVALTVVHIRARHIAVASFPRSSDAERAYTRLGGDAPWRHEVAFIERHGRGAIGLRGTFAGRRVDIDDLGGADGVLLVEVAGDLGTGESGLLLFGPRETADAMARAFSGGRARIVRRRLSAREARALRASVADAPPAKALNETEVW